MKRNEYTIGDYEITSRLRRLNPNNILFCINDAIDWRPIQDLVSPLDRRKINQPGRDCYDPFMMLKIQFIQDLKGYSDVQMEERLISDTLYMWFCGMSSASQVPDHSTISRWRDRFNKSDISKQAFFEINKQLSAVGLKYKKGAVVDATLIHSYSRLRNKDEVYEVDNKTGDIVKLDAHIKKVRQDNIPPSDTSVQSVVLTNKIIDPDAKIIKIGKKITYGYKMHTVTDLEGLLINLNTTSANVLEATQLENLLSIFGQDSYIPILADKGYCWQKCIDYLNYNGFIDLIMRKKKKGKELEISTSLRNKLISKHRYVIERTFGGLKRWLKLGRAKYIGLEKTHNHNFRLAMIYNIVRCVGVT
jgi:IS5 family transposase